MLGEGLLSPPPGALSTKDASSWLTARPRTALLGILAVVVSAGIGALGIINLRYGIAGIAAVAVVVVVLLRPFIGGLILAGLVPIISGLAPGMPVPSIRASEGLIGLVGVTLIVSARRRDAVKWNPIDWALLAYGLAWLAMGAIDSRIFGEHLSFSDWGTVAGQLQFFLVYRGVRLSIRTQRERRIAFGAVFVALLPVAILAILQEIHFPGLNAFLYKVTGSGDITTSASQAAAAPLSQTSGTRATGPFPNWTSLSGYLFPLLLVLISLFLGGQVGRRRKLFLAITVLGLGALMVSEEQSAIIGLVAGIIALGLMYHQTKRVAKWLLVGAVVGAIAVGPILSARLSRELNKSASTASSSGIVPQTMAFRWQIWTGQYFPAIGQQPVTGYGVVTPKSIQWDATESEYVTILMEGGFPLLILFGTLMWAMIRQSRKQARAPDPFDRAVGMGLTVSLVALVVMDIVWPYMSNGGLPQVLFALLALAEPLATGAAARRAVAPAAPPEALAQGSA